MPLSPRPVASSVFMPWAANLLPEAAALKAVSLRLGASQQDVIAILSEIGRDTAGALSIGEPGSTSPAEWREIPNAKALERIIRELPNKPFLVGDDGVSMSLAGVQSKIGLARNERGKLCVPLYGAPSTFILKPDAIDRLHGSVQNEAICLVLARRCGLLAPPVTTGKAGSRSYLLVSRYDRVQQQGVWRRIHQEDFCQALGRTPDAKYESNQLGEPGPSLPEMFALTRNLMRAPDLLNLLDYVLFNVMVCNTDSHAKNYSMLISARGFQLAPIYDVMCAAAWDGITQNLPQKIAGKNRGDHLKRRHWEAFAKDCGLNSGSVVSRIEALVGVVQRELPHAIAEVEAMPAGTHFLIPEFRKAIEARGRRILTGLAEGGTRASNRQPAPLHRQRKPKASEPIADVGVAKRRVRLKQVKT